MEGEWELVCDLSNGVNSNDLERTLTPFSWSRYYYSTSNNSQTVQDTAIVTIESHTWSIEPRHFQWPWTIPHPHFKVRPFFDAEYLRNGCRYSHSYYGRRIETRMLSIKWCHLQWPWTNPNPVFKVIPLFGAKYLKRLQIRPELL